MHDTNDNYYSTNMNVIKPKQRLTYLDMVSGIMIIYMIFMHCCQFTHITGTTFFKRLSVVFICFMIWFFFKSDMFYKREGSFKDL